MLRNKLFMFICTFISVLEFSHAGEGLGLKPVYDFNVLSKTADFAHFNSEYVYRGADNRGFDIYRAWRFDTHANVKGGHGPGSWQSPPLDFPGRHGTGIARMSFNAVIPLTDSGLDLAHSKFDIDVVFVLDVPKALLPGLPDNCFTAVNVILCNETINDAQLAHELNHVAQWDLLGPMFLPAFLFDRSVFEDYIGNAQMLAPCLGEMGGTCGHDPLIRIENGKVTIKPFFSAFIRQLFHRS